MEGTNLFQINTSVKTSSNPKKGVRFVVSNTLATQVHKTSSTLLLRRSQKLVLYCDVTFFVDNLKKHSELLKRLNIFNLSV